MKQVRLAITFVALLTVALVLTAPAAAADTANVAGEWNLTVETPNGTGTPTVIFKQDGENLTGTYKGRYGESALKGTVKGNEIKFSVTINAGGQELEIEYSGTVEGSSMKGKAKFGDMGEGAFTGKKAAAKPPA
jgi:D-glucosaminate-6-phosphate ammonia-lyase